ncbi:MAG: FAD:protein FMN transferase [Candidatus Binatia bacterium]
MKPGSAGARASLALGLAGALVGTCVAGEKAQLHTATVGTQVMGTVLQLRVVHADPKRAADLAAAAVELARHWDDVLTTFRPEGELARLNAYAGRGPMVVSSDLYSALKRMLDLRAATGGAFDPAVGPLVEYWRAVGPRGPVPRPSPALRLNTALELTGSAGVSLAAGALVDAGGIGKGIALDAIAELLSAGGATGAYLDFGGSSQRAFGRDGDQRPWVVAVSGLRRGRLHGTLELDGRALSTSRSKPDGDPAGSIIDPSTLHPVPVSRLATALAPDATSAEAWSTALVILGRIGLDAARTAGVEALYEDADGVYTSAGFPINARAGDASARSPGAP